MTTRTMDLIVNGTPTQTPDGQSVQELVDQLGLADQPVAVEVNQHVVPRKLHPQTMLRDGDRIEIVTLVGGG